MGASASFYIISILALLCLLFLSALISGSEVAFFSLSPEQVSFCKTSDKEKDKSIVRLLKEPHYLLANILILNNLANVGLIVLSTYVTTRIFGSDGSVVVLLTIIVTLALVFYGELVPKQFASENNLSFAQLVVLPLSLAGRVMHPLAWVLTRMSNLIERRIENRGYQASVDELNQALEITTRTDTSEEEKGILKGIVNFGTLSVKQVMRSRLDITALDYQTDFHTLMDKINKSGYSRIPIYKDTIDNVEGILYIKEVLPYIEEPDTFAWQTLIHKGFFVPENKKVDTLLRDFQEKRVHMAIVVDEYGGTSGLITLEDVIEEIVGEINDEFDDDEVHFNKLDESTFVFEGKTTLNDFSKITNEDSSVFDEVKGESESLGGLLLEIHAKLPRAGEKIVYKNFVFTVVAVDQKRIKRVRVFIREPFQSSKMNPVNKTE